MAYTKKCYSGPDEVVAALRATKSESKRTLLDTAANMIEALSEESFRLYQAERERRKAPMTNADLIRAMSDEELVKILKCPRLTGLDRKHNCLSVSCRDCVLKWLQQPAKEDA